MNKSLSNTELAIRTATFEDVSIIQNISMETWPAVYTPLLGKEQVEYMLHKFYNPSSLIAQMKNNHYFFLAVKEYIPIGFASFSNVNENIYKLQKLYVLPSAQKTGAGKALLQKVETVAKSMGAAKLQLNVNRKNNAKTFYEKNDFVIIRQEDIDIDNGYFMNDYVMEKDLQK